VILRILRGRSGRDDLAGLLEAVRIDIREWAAIDSALVSAQPAYREAGDEVEFILVSTWSEAEAVLARGGEISRPRGRVDESGLLRDGRAEHYELMLGRPGEAPRAGHIVRVSSMGLVPRRSSAFYERVRELWDQTIGDAGLVAVLVGRRAEPEFERAVVVSVWEDEPALRVATATGFVGGEEMRSFYATEPVIEHFKGLALDPPADPAAA
jgi:quinol monooxygenase YgiN